MTIAQSLLPEFDAEMESTRKVLAAVPDGNFDWKPHAKSMTLGLLSMHVAGMPEWGCMTLKDDQLVMGPGDYKPKLPTSTAELLSQFEKGRVEFRQVLAECSDETMRRIWTMIWGGQKIFEMPKIEVLRGMVMNHMIHHRGQLTVYLRLLDTPVPGVYGPSADEVQSNG